MLEEAGQNGEAMRTVDPANKLALVEMLLGSDDSSACARRGINWLQTHLQPRQALLAIASPQTHHLRGVAALTVTPARATEFVVDLESRREPLPAAAWGDAPAHFPTGPRHPLTPLGVAPFWAIPLHAATAPPIGLLLLEGTETELDPAAPWWATVVAEKLYSLRGFVPGPDRALERERHMRRQLEAGYRRLIALEHEARTKCERLEAEVAAQHELLRQQAASLEQTFATRSQFLANVSHEFRTPLNAIVGYSLMLLGSFYGRLSESQSRAVQRIDANSKHLATLINDALDIERIEAGRMPIQMSLFALHALVKEVMDELQDAVGRSAATVSIDVPADLPRLKSDRDKVKQILLNFVSNALKYTKEGRVEVGARHDLEQGCLCIEVRDSGVGIASEDHGRIFEPFQQAKRVITRPQGGNGFGLAISRRLAHLLGGEVWVDSTLGKGSTFSVTLPVRPRFAAPARVRGRNQGSGISGQ